MDLINLKRDWDALCTKRRDLKWEFMRWNNDINITYNKNGNVIEITRTLDERNRYYNLGKQWYESKIEEIEKAMKAFQGRHNLKDLDYEGVTKKLQDLINNSRLVLGEFIDVKTDLPYLHEELLLPSNDKTTDVLVWRLSTCFISYMRKDAMSNNNWEWAVDGVKYWSPIPIIPNKNNQ